MSSLEFKVLCVLYEKFPMLLWRIEGTEWMWILVESVIKLEYGFTKGGNFQSHLSNGIGKALGPDGFMMIVFQDCLDSIKDDSRRVSNKFNKSELIKCNFQCTSVRNV